MMNNKDRNNSVSEEWNINQDWLDIITNLMITFVTSDFDNNYEDMYKALMHLETFCSPTIDKNNVEKNLEIIRVKMDTMEKRDSDGNLICYYPLAQREVQKLLHETHALVLQMLDTEGILKKIKRDPRSAMGNFGNS
jgi:hypothetical protein